MTDDTDLVLAARAGQRAAFATLVDRWFDRCWDVAWRILHDRDLAADVTQDTLLVAWRRLEELDRPESFGGWVLRIARNRALDRLKRERRTLPTGDDAQLEPDVRTHDTGGPEAALVRGEQRDLVWAAAAALGERDASMLDLHLRHGLEPAELAEELDIAPNAAHQAVFRLRQRLGSAIRAWLLWRNADPACVVLRAELAASGDREFGAGTVRLVRRHVKTCTECADEQERIAAPAMLFSVVPLVAVPTAARAQVLQRLADAGVPVGGQAGGIDRGDGSSGGGTDGDGGAGADGHGGGGPDGAGAVTRPVVGGATSTTHVGSTATLPVARGGPGGGAWASRVGRRNLVVLALTLVLLLSAGGWAWSRGRAVPPTPVPTTQVTAPAVAPVASPSPSARPPAETAAPDDPADVPELTPRTPTLPEPPPVEPPPVDPRPVDPAPSEPPAQVEPAPTIGRFAATFVGWCDNQDPQFELFWDAQGADAATLSGPGGSEQVQPSGAALRCAPDGSVFTLTVTGPGGTASASATGSAPVAPE